MFCSKMHESVHKAISAIVSTRRRWGRGEKEEKRQKWGRSKEEGRGVNKMEGEKLRFLKTS